MDRLTGTNMKIWVLHLFSAFWRIGTWVPAAQDLSPFQQNSLFACTETTGMRLAMFLLQPWRRLVLKFQQQFPPWCYCRIIPQIYKSMTLAYVSSVDCISRPSEGAYRHKTILKFSTVDSLWNLYRLLRWTQQKWSRKLHTQTWETQQK